MAKKDGPDKIVFTVNDLRREDCLARVTRRGYVLINKKLCKISGIKAGDLVLVMPDGMPYGPKCIRIIKVDDEDKIREIILSHAK